MTDILKADGTKEPFDTSKLEASLRRAGASERVSQHITKVISSSIVSGIDTHEIYRRAFSMLRDEERSVAARYSLRRALFELGP